MNIKNKIYSFMKAKRKSSHLIMLIAGVYLPYLMYKMDSSKDLINMSSMTVHYLIMAVMGIAAVLFLSFSVTALAKGFYVENKHKNDEK